MKSTNVIRMFLGEEQLNSVNRMLRPGKIVKQLAKFFLALFCYLSVNIVVWLVFNGVHINCYVVFAAVAQGVQMFVTQCVGLLFSFVTNYGFYALLAFAGMVGFGCVLVVRRIVVRKDDLSSCNVNFDGGAALSSRIVVSNYKQHIQFLS